MKILAFLVVFLATAGARAFAIVTVSSFSPSVLAPQPIGKTITWTVTATNSNSGPLAFQFWITPPSGSAALVKDFNLGTLAAGIWSPVPFIWVPTGVEGLYQLQVVVKDFGTGESNSRTAFYQITPAVLGSTPRAERTANPLVALFSAPSCPTGSSMRVAFLKRDGTAAATATHWTPCHPPKTMTFEVAGMYPSTAYVLYAQTVTNGVVKNGMHVTFTTGALPTDITFPEFTVTTPPSDSSYPVILHNLIQLAGSTVYPDVATDLQGRIMWYFSPNDNNHNEVLVRPLSGGGLLTIQNDTAWTSRAGKEQFLRQIDLAGNLVRETNMGAIQQQLLALGAVDGGPCDAIPSPPPVGAGCVGAFHHDAIVTLPNGWTAALLDVEKIYPPGTQGDTSPLPVDVIGDMIIVMDSNWQVRWYWDAFNPGGGGKGHPGLPVSRTAPLKETCGTNTPGCPPIFLLGPGVAPLAHDWLHANTLYYWPNNGSTTAAPGDIIWSSRSQDWLFKIDYKDGAGTGDILWKMGYGGDFTFVNTYSDPFPWFSHQHDSGIEGGGLGLMTIFDNGNTRLSSTPPGLGSHCAPYDCNSRGMAVTFDERTMQVTPVVSLDLGAYSPAMGSAQRLGNGNYFFENPLVLLDVSTTVGYSLELGADPPAPQVGPANVRLNLSGPEQYRAWQMPSLYYPPGT